MWIFLDYSMDIFYLIDLVFIKPRVMYLEDGFWVQSPKLTRKNYFRKFQFKVSSDICLINIFQKKMYFRSARIIDLVLCA